MAMMASITATSSWVVFTLRKENHRQTLRKEKKETLNCQNLYNESIYFRVKSKLNEIEGERKRKQEHCPLRC